MAFQAGDILVYINSLGDNQDCEVFRRDDNGPYVWVRPINRDGKITATKSIRMRVNLLRYKKNV